MTGTTGTRLLIVDDEAAQMQALCNTLGENGFETIGCANAEAALAELQRSSFDLLLADLMMPGMSGIELLRAALAIDPTLVGIIMTGEGTISSAVDAMRSGALDYILKPFKVSAILPVLERGLTVRRLQLKNLLLERQVREHAAELEVTNRELDATNRELDAFTRSASHDLRSPLNIVQGFSTLLLNKLGPQIPAEQRKWLVNIERSAQSMRHLIDALIRLSRVGRQALYLQTVDVGPLVRSVFDDLSHEQPQRHVTLQIGDLPVIAADESLLRQLFVNLLSNAFKFTRDKESAVIEVGCAPQGEERVFFIRDNGAGFDMAHAEGLFDAFRRLHRADQFEGTGVGLSIVQRIVQRHGGRIWAVSVPDQGATFFLTLEELAKPALPVAS